MIAVGELRARWDRFWHAPMPAIRLEVFRQALLLALFAYLLHRFMYASEWLSAHGYHPSPAVDGVNAPLLPLVPEDRIAWFGALLLGSLALAMMARLSWVRRPATWVLLGCVLHVSLVDPISAFTINRIFMFALLVLALAPAPREPGRGEPGLMMPAWPVRLLQTHLLLFYLASGVCKAVQGRWLVEADLLWRQLQGAQMTETAAWLVRSLPRWVFTVQQGLGLGFEILAPILIGVRRLRPIGVAMGIGMHLLVSLEMKHLIYFGLQTICFYVLFIDERRLGRWYARLAR